MNTQGFANCRKATSAFKKYLPALCILLFFFIILIYTQKDYGETWDEWEHFANGEEYYSYLFERGPVPPLYQHGFKKFYGPCMDIVAIASRKFFCDRLGWLSRWQALHLHCVVLFILGGACIYHTTVRLYGRAGALCSLGCFFLLPRLLGESHNNMKDFPVSMLILCASLSFWEAMYQTRYRWILATALWTGLALATKINGFLLPPFYLASLIIMCCCHPRVRQRWGFLLSGPCLMLPLLSAAVLLLCWPWLREDPVHRLRETVRFFQGTNSPIFNGPVLYFGRMTRASDIPWNYPAAYILITTPLILLPFFFIGIARSFYELCFRKDFLLIALLAFLIPVLAVTVGHSPKYDGLRQFLPALPFLAILSALGIHWVWGVVYRRLRYVASGAVICIFLALAWQDATIHPYQTVFFNYLVGGVKGAEDRFELDYWGNSLKTASQWINAHAERNSRIYVPAGIGRLLSVRDDLIVTHVDPDYAVVLVRESIVENPYKGQKPVHAIEANGAELCRIYKTTPPYNQDKIEPEPDAADLVPGVLMTIYAGRDSKRVISSGTVQDVYFDKKSPEYKELGLGDNFSIVWEGYLCFPEEGIYGIASSTKPESYLFLSNVLLIHNVLTGQIWEKAVRKRFEKGYYPLRVELRGSGDGHMALLWKLPSFYNRGEYTAIPRQYYYQRRSVPKEPA